MDCGESYVSSEELQIHMTTHSKKKSTKESCHYTLFEELKCIECEYKTEIKSELKLHMKKHTGESPEKNIDQSFADIVMAPINQIGASVTSHSGPNTRKIRKTSTSQPANEITSKTPSKRTRGISQRPDCIKVHKKLATNTEKS